MQILLTGATGFLGRNLISRLKEIGSVNILALSRYDDLDRLAEELERADIVFHFAAVHRPQNSSDYVAVNQGLTANILEALQRVGNRVSIIYTSTIQAIEETDYGRSKRAAEHLLIKHAEFLRSPVYIYRLNNIFGKWARPNEHSVVATWCHNISRGLPIRIDEPDRVMKMLHVDDVIDRLLTHIVEAQDVPGPHYRAMEDQLMHRITLKEIAETLYSIQEGRFHLSSDDKNFRMKIKLFTTFLTYMP